MAKKSARRTPRLAKLKASVEVEVQRPPFKLLSSVKQLDVDRLARAARAEVELGYVESECCRQLVRAIIRKGKVTGIEVDPCKEADKARPPREFVALFKKAQKQLAARSGGKSPLPMPVQEFLPQAAIITVDVITCFRICIYGFCITCCTTLDPNDPLACGPLTIDRTVWH